MNSISITVARTETGKLVAGLLALLLGLTLVGGIGFASDMAVHNGAHDARHAIGFPCH